MKADIRYQHVEHSFPPVYGEDSKILILGSLPSVKSREQGFYYGHPKNRFWTLLASILSCQVPVTIEEKKEMLLRHRIAVYDVISSCDIIGSSDSTIKNVVPVDLKDMIEKSNIKTIYANGKLAARLYRKYLEPQTGLSVTELPSTSPANASYSLSMLQSAWNVIASEL